MRTTSRLLVLVALITAIVIVGVAACGVEVVGGATAVEDDASAGINEDGSGPSRPGDEKADGVLADGGAGDVVTTVVDGGATIDAPYCAPDLANCGGCNLACPSGSTACVANNCIATLTIAVRIDGYSDLLIYNNTARWHHLVWDPPGKTTLNGGVGWTPTWPSPPGGCGSCGDPSKTCPCDSVNTGALSPPLPAHDQTASVTKTAGPADGEVTIVQQPSQANGYTLILHFGDPALAPHDFGATVTYQSR